MQRHLNCVDESFEQRKICVMQSFFCGVEFGSAQSSHFFRLLPIHTPQQTGFIYTAHHGDRHRETECV